MVVDISNAQASQDFVPLKEVRDGVIIMRDGSMKSILMCSSLNFALKSDDEQNAFLMQFQNFLNSLDFHVQIFIQSRKLDIRPYLATLEESLKGTLDELMRIQIREYINFIRSFTEAANIMTKHFFVVVPYLPPNAVLQSGPLSKITAPFMKAGRESDKNEGGKTDFEEHVSQLEQRISVVQQGLVRTGIRSVQLGTEEVIELLYRIFNPGEQDNPMKGEATNNK
jgi:type IV secretory pathway VirB4 component